MSSRLQRKVVVYTRYSSSMQREESCEDQERGTRDELTRKRLDLLRSEDRLAEDSLLQGALLLS